MQLSDKQQLMLQQLRELLTFGYEKLSKVELKRKGITLKKKLLFYMMGATQSYAESILKIITPNKDHSSIYDKSALILVRSITENLINIGFIHACDTQANAARFTIDYLQDTVKFAKRHQKFMLKYPNTDFPEWDLSFGYGKTDKRNINKPEDWEKVIKKLKRKIASNQRRYKLNPTSILPNLKIRCEEHDEYLKSKSKLNSQNSLEKLYVIYYSYFSQIAHLTAPGLDTFIKTSPDGSMWADVDAPAEEIETIVPITYTVYFSILTFFLKRFNAYHSSEVKNYKELSQTMGFK